MLGRLILPVVAATLLATHAAAGLGLPLDDTLPAVRAEEAGPTTVVLPSEHAPQDAPVDAPVDEAPEAPDDLDPAGEIPPADDVPGEVPDDVPDGLPDLGDDDPADDGDEEEQGEEEDEEEDEDDEDAVDDPDPSTQDGDGGAGGSGDAPSSTAEIGDVDDDTTTKTPPTSPPASAEAEAQDEDAAPVEEPRTDPFAAAPVAAPGVGEARNPWTLIGVGMLGVAGAASIGWAYWRSRFA